MIQASNLILFLAPPTSPVAADRTSAKPRTLALPPEIAVRRDFARQHPEHVTRFTPAHLNALLHAPLLREAYRCHWRIDTESARRLFRRAFRKADWKAGGLKHLIASLLPAPLYRKYR